MPRTRQQTFSKVIPAACGMIDLVGSSGRNNCGCWNVSMGEKHSELHATSDTGASAKNPDHTPCLGVPKCQVGRREGQKPWHTHPIHMAKRGRASVQPTPGQTAVSRLTLTDQARFHPIIKFVVVGSCWHETPQDRLLSTPLVALCGCHHFSTMTVCLHTNVAVRKSQWWRRWCQCP